MKKTLLAVALSVGIAAFSSFSFAASTYYVATTGNDANSCTTASNISAPKKTIASGIRCLVAGDTLYLRGGTYVEGLVDNSFYQGTVVAWGNGTSYTNAYTVKAYPGELPIIQPIDGPALGMFQGGQYWIWDGIVFDGFYQKTGTNVDLHSPAAHIRLINVEIRNTGRALGGFASATTPTNTNGVLAGAPDIQLLNCRIHDNGNGPYDHGVYGGGDDLIDNCDIYRNAGWGVHKYPVGDNMILRNSRIYDNAQSLKAGAQNGAGTGIGLYGGSNNQVYNTVISGNETCLTMNYSEGVDHIFNIVCYGNTNGITDYSGAGDFKNVIIYGNGTDIINPAAGVFSFSICSQPMPGCTIADPKFVNPAARDFRLQAGSPAIGTGTDLSAFFKTDMTGALRATPWDIGPYKSGPSQIPAANKFLIGDRIDVINGPANVRGAAGDTLLGQQANGAQGTVIGGPLASAIIGSLDATIYNWWNVNFDSGIDGWVGEGTLEKIPALKTPLSPVAIKLSMFSSSAIA